MVMKRFCDRCGEEIGYPSLTLSSRSFTNDTILKQGEIPFREFCDKCKESFFEWLKNSQKETKSTNNNIINAHQKDFMVDNIIGQDSSPSDKKKEQEGKQEDTQSIMTTSTHTKDYGHKDLIDKDYLMCPKCKVNKPFCECVKEKEGVKQ